jgi:predicted permease
MTHQLEELRTDITFALRQLKGARGFTFLAVIALALGIGANAAIFSVLKSVLLDSLPYTDADRLVRVYERQLDGSREQGTLSAGSIRDIRQREASFSHLAAFLGVAGAASDAVLADDTRTRVAKVAWVEVGFFEVLGVEAERGRTFRPGDAISGMALLSGGMAAPDTPSAVIVTSESWQQQFGSDPAAIGRSIRINGVPRTIVGVLPPGFVGPMGKADFYLAFDLDSVLANPISSRGAHWLGLVARLDDGRTHDFARRELTAIGADLAREYPHDNGSIGLTAIPLRDSLVGDVRRPLLLVMASAALVLFIACANLASALLSRTLTRRKEFAIRAALGAQRNRVVRQLLTEATILALMGGTAGLLLASLMLRLFRALPLEVVPAYADVVLDGEAIIFTTIVALCTGLAFGLAPALSVGRLDQRASLRDDARGLSESRRSRNLRGALVAVQMGLCVSLLVGSGLLVKSLWAMTTAPIGVDPDEVLTGAISITVRDYPTAEARTQLYQRLVDLLGDLPGVTAAAVSSAIPMAVSQHFGLGIEGAPVPDGGQPVVLAATVSDEYFQTLRIPLRAGRLFDARDRTGASPVVVVSESMARRYWPRGNALGARIRLGANPNSALIEVVGVVGNVRNDRARPDAEPMVYQSTRQTALPPNIHFVLRTTNDPLALATTVEKELARFDAGLPVQRVTSLPTFLDNGLAGRRLPVMLVGAFGGLALLLASIGVYAMFASMTAAREREFGVRMALGSPPQAIGRLVLRQGAVWIVAGLAGGAAGVPVVTRLVRDLLYGVSPFDPATLAVSISILVASATVALLIPVRRAIRIDPTIALQAQ